MVDKYNMKLDENIFLAKRVLVSSIYNSAKLEGLNVSFDDVKNLLDGVNVPNVKLDDINCILNLRDAWREMLSSLNDDLSIDYLCKINYFVSRNESLEWGVLRTGKVGIAGTDYLPDIPNKEIVINDLNKLSEIECVTLRAIKIMLYSMRSQLFWDGNKRTSTIIANKIMIQNGKGIITVKEDYLLEFNKLLTEFYNTNDDRDIVKFIYDNCVFGIE